MPVVVVVHSNSLFLKVYLIFCQHYYNKTVSEKSAMMLIMWNFVLIISKMNLCVGSLPEMWNYLKTLRAISLEFLCHLFYWTEHTCMHANTHIHSILLTWVIRYYKSQLHSSCVTALFLFLCHFCSMCVFRFADNWRQRGFVDAHKTCFHNT